MGNKDTFLLFLSPPEGLLYVVFFWLLVTCAFLLLFPQGAFHCIPKIDWPKAAQNHLLQVKSDFSVMKLNQTTLADICFNAI